MRIAATLAVVFLHTCNALTDNPGLFILSEEQRCVFQLGHYLMNWAVPVFMMITGFLLLDKKKEISSHDILWKYFGRILLVLLLFGIPFSMIETLSRRSDILLFQILMESIQNILNGKSWSHLWYLYTLGGVYLTLPIWKVYSEHSSTHLQTFILVILFVFDFILPMIVNIFGYGSAFILPISSYFIFYLLLGGFFKNEIPSRKVNSKVILSIGCFALILILMIVIFASNPKQYLNYDSPIIAILSLCIFVFGIKTDVKMKMLSTNSERIWKVDRLCFGVYIIHPLFINCFYKLLKISPLISRNLYWLLTFAFFLVFTILSFGTSYVLNKNRFLHKWVL